MKNAFIKKALILTIIGIFLGLSVSPLAIAYTNLETNAKKNTDIEIYTKTFKFSSPQLFDTGDSIIIVVEEATYYTQSTGQPMLPYTSFVFKFPLGTSIHHIEFIYSNPQQIYLNKPVKLAPPLNWYYAKSTPSDRLVTSTVDDTSLPWCSYHLGGGIDKGQHVTFLPIHIYPVHYDFEKATLEYINQIDINIFYEPLQPLIQEDTYSFVIIASSNFVSPLKRLVNHKTKNGLITKLVSLDDIYNGIYFPADGYDEPEQIKYFIKNAVEQWGTDYVLLVGSIYKLPMRSAWFGNFELLTDMYYADLYFNDGTFCSWDSNNNNFYGEYWHNDEKDFIDLYADVYLGRLPCQNILEVYIAVNKIINYESKSRDDWWDKIILLGGDTFPGWGLNEGEITNECIAKALPDFTHVKLWTSEGTFTPEKINQEINKGARFLEYSGHGFEFGMGTYPPNGQNQITYRTRHLQGLHNLYKLPVVFFDACLTAKLDYSLGDLVSIFKILDIPLPVYSWYWVKKIGGGAIATIGATEIAFSYVNDHGPHGGAGYMSLHFFEGYHHCETVSEMLVYSQNDYLNNLWKDHWTIEQFILLGDPTLKVGGGGE